MPKSLILFEKAYYNYRYKSIYMMLHHTDEAGITFYPLFKLPAKLSALFHAFKIIIKMVLRQVSMLPVLSPLAFIFSPGDFGP